MCPKNNLVNGSPPRKYTIEQLEISIVASIYWSDVLNLLGISFGYQNLQSVKDRAVKLSHDTSHLLAQRAPKNPIKKYIPAQQYLNTENKIGSACMRVKLLSENLIENQCVLCGLAPVWNGKPITLQLDHINGNKHDNRLENLRILCPNCHAQTDTYGSRNPMRYGG